MPSSRLSREVQSFNLPSWRRKKLAGELGIPTRVVSMPSIGVSEKRPETYQKTVLSDSPHIVSVEAYVSTIWARLCTASISMDSFGYSGAGSVNFRHFDLDSDSIARKIQWHVQGTHITAKRWVRLEQKII
ncbi:transketolase [Aspergillus pseudonomiae]|uniref:Transketolase n=1 Tax=Aspergillus pseudonomiae TaxID=1506151 RepID=A0A5N6HRI9_9EURO|nr:transketolase [Aspergillus pseudonomiae]KAB8256454.1 transketolase [Aspergillus pseudonomiae]KAE8400294.1 transketolase [Aspergillus pseudonomiae]